MAVPDIFFAAVNSGNLILVKSLMEGDKALIEAKDSYGCSPLHIAVQADSLEIVAFLLDNGADINVRDLNGYVPLHDAKSLEMAEMLLSRGADVNAKDDYGLIPLHNAVLEGYTEIVELFIRNGADIQARENNGWTPLLMAVEYRLPHIEEVLRCHGASK